MHIGILRLSLTIPGADSLKDKRQVIRSLLQHLRQKFNISAAEVDDLDIWRRATLGIAFVSNEGKYANQVLSQVVNHVEDDWRVTLEDYTLEFVTGGSAMDSAEDSVPDVGDWFLESKTPSP